MLPLIKYNWQLSCPRSTQCHRTKNQNKQTRKHRFSTAYHLSKFIPCIADGKAPGWLPAQAPTLHHTPPARRQEKKGV